MTSTQDRRPPREAVRLATTQPTDRPVVAVRSSHPVAVLVRRPDLYGVSKLADVTTDAVLWSV